MTCHDPSQSQKATRLARTRHATIIAVTAVVVLMSLPATSAIADDYDKPPISYRDAKTHDPIDKLQAKLKAGKAKLTWQDDLGYLRSLLKQLDVPVESQVLVFSKTSLQRNGISPQRPRAIFFNDDVYIGNVQGGEVLEISVQDPTQGAIFYTLNQQPDPNTGQPIFKRQNARCTLCHASSHTRRVPGHLVRSVFVRPTGMPVYSAGTYRTNQDSPFNERWGGWYVSGTHGGMRHLGNAVVPNGAEAEDLDMDEGANKKTVGDYFDGAYLSKHSDIVALMVLEHQGDLHNLLTALNFQTRIAMQYNAMMNKMDEKPKDFMRPSTLSRIKSVAEPALRYMLYADEFKLTSPVKGTSGFTELFNKRGPQDRKGRSLYQLDLSTRMFKHPLSYLVYSEPFDVLPAPAKDYLYKRLWEVLNNRDTSGDGKRGEEGGDGFPNLSKADRLAIKEILLDTKKDLPSYWRNDDATSQKKASAKLSAAIGE